MTVNATTSKGGPYLGNGVTTNFTYPFRILDEDHIRVIITDLTGAETDASPSDYTVSGVGGASGTVSYKISDPLPTGHKLTILRDVPITQTVDISNSGGFYPESHETVFDKLTMIVQQQEEVIGRSITVQASDDESDPTEIIATILVARGEAEAARDAAEDAADEADTSAALSQAWAEGTLPGGGGTKSSKEWSEESEASATAAAQLLGSAMFRDVVFITSANSPYTINQTHNGKMIAVDSSGGNVVINLPQISSLTLPYTLGIKKTSSDGNSITISRAGSDTIDGNTSKVITFANSGATFLPDIDPTPDRWTTAEFGAAVGNITVDAFTGNGVRITDTLSVSPGSKNNTTLIIGGVPQLKSSYSLSGTTLTYGAAPANGVQIEVWSGTALPIGVTADNSVSWAKLAGALIGSASDIIAGTANKLIDAVGIKDYIDTYVATNITPFKPVARGYVDTTGGALVTKKVLGCTASRTGVGSVQVTLTAAQPNTDYTVIMNFVNSAGTSSSIFSFLISSTTVFVMNGYNSSGTAREGVFTWEVFAS